MGCLDGGMHGFPSLVAMVATGTRSGLLHGLTGQYPKGDRDTRLDGQLGEALGDTLADVAIVGRLSCDDASKGDDGIGCSVPLVDRQASTDGGEFEGARCLDAYEPVGQTARFQESGPGRVLERSGDLGVVPAGDNRDSKRVGFECRDIV